MNVAATNFENWSLSTKHYIFNDMPAVDDDGLGWDFHPYQITPENYKGNFYPILVFLIAHPKKLLKPANSLKNPTKNLLQKFHNPGISQVILNISILCKSQNNNPLFKYNNEKYQWDPINLPMKRYEFLLADFWEKHQIYKKPYYVRYEGDQKCLYSELDDNWQRIFMRIWKISCVEEGRALISEWDFMKQLYPIRCLSEDLASQNSLLLINDEKFQNKIKFYIGYDSNETPFEGVYYKNWTAIKSTTREKAYHLRLLDACYFLNMFSNKLNYTSIKCALELFLLKMYESLGDELLARKLLAKCQFCEKYILYLRDKKYCSESCRQKAYYQRHPELKQRSKKRMKELRGLYKQHGIK